jgi:hypothetical protein
MYQSDLINLQHFSFLFHHQKYWDQKSLQNINASKVLTSANDIKQAEEKP